MTKIFEPVQEGHDGKGRVVFICIDSSGYYVMKPQTGFRSTHFTSVDDVALQASFNRQVGCSQNAPFYQTDDAPKAGEKYPVLKAKAVEKKQADKSETAASKKVVAKALAEKK